MKIKNKIENLYLLVKFLKEISLIKNLGRGY